MDRYDIFTAVIKTALSDEHSLPSLPEITLKIRLTISDPNCTSLKLANLIRHDPALSALLIKTLNSPAFLGGGTKLDLEGVISYLGHKAVANLVMYHSISSVFVTKNAQLKKLFALMWQHQYKKTGTAVYLAKKLVPDIQSDVLLSCLLTEVGSMAILSAFEELSDIPTEADYIMLCRKFSKLLTERLLKSWNVNQSFIDTAKNIGKWSETERGRLNSTDIINLSIYHSGKKGKANYQLPPITELAAYAKIFPPNNDLSEDGELLIVSEHGDLINNIIHSFL